MKLLTILLAFIYGLLILFIFPLIFIQLNTIYSLTVYSFLLLKILGICLVLFGISIWVYCVGLFHFIGKGTPVPVNPPKKLVIKGVYKYTRNPMYISALIILFGYFLFFGHLSLLLYLFLIAIFFNLFVLFYEEPILKKRFGKKYIEYCKNAPRWL